MPWAASGWSSTAVSPDRYEQYLALRAAAALPAAAGFSDGATYALALGRANGTLFSRIIAFSPGFLIPAHLRGSPRIFISHGRQDDVLLIDSCSRIIVPRLRRDGYDVTYREFDGEHEVPDAIVREALEWFVGGVTTGARESVWHAHPAHEPS